MKKWGAGILLGAATLFGLGMYFLMGYATARARHDAFSPSGRYFAQTSDPYFTWYWSGWTDGYLTITDLATRESATLRVDGLNLESTRLAWSAGDRPFLAVVHRSGVRRVLYEGYSLQESEPGTTRLLIYSTQNGSVRDIPLSGESRSPLPSWSPDGRSLGLWSRDEPGPAYLWKEGQNGVRAAGPAGEALASFLWMADGGLLIVTTGKDGHSRFYASGGERPGPFEEITAHFPPLDETLSIHQSRVFPDLFIVSQRSYGKSGGKWSTVLVRRGDRSPLKVWEGSSVTYLPYLPPEGKDLFLIHRVFDSQKRRLMGSSFSRISLPDLAETPILEGIKVAEWGDLTVDPAGSWYGVQESGWERNGWLPSRSVTVLHDENRLKKKPLRFSQTASGWMGDQGHYRFAIERMGAFFPDVSLLDPVSGREEKVPAALAWPALFAPEMAPFWLSLFGFLLNGALFAVLFYGRSHSEGARPLGLFFFCLAWACVSMEAPGIVHVIYESAWEQPYGEALFLALFAAFLMLIAALATIPYAAIRFATAFPHPNPYGNVYPKRVRTVSALTLSLPVLASLLPILYLAFQVLDRMDSPLEPDQTIKQAERGVGSALILLKILAGALGVFGAMVLVLAIVAVVSNYLLAPSQKTKGQLRYIALGLSCFVIWGCAGKLLESFLKGGVTELAYVVKIVPSVFRDYIFPLIYLGLLMVIPAAFCGYALLSSELLDLSFVIRRTVKYAVVVGVLGLLFVGIVAGLGVLLPSVLGSSSPVTAALASVATVLAFQPVRRKVQDWVDKRFDRPRYDARKTLADLTSRFSTMGTVTEVRSTLEGAARDVLRVGESRLLFFRGGKIRAAGTEAPESLEAVDVAGLDPREIQGLLSVDLPWVKLAVPVGDRARAFAVLALGEKLSQEKFSPEDREFLKILTDGAGLALKNLALVREATKAEVLQRDLQAARAIQARYFPESLPEVPGYRLAASYTPARIVGGDDYDAFLLPDGRLAFLVADVSGKGMPAALRVAELHSYLRALLPGSPEAGAVLGRLNEYLCASLDKLEFVTAFLGLLDPPSGRLDYACAGHPPPLLRGPSGPAAPLAGEGSLPLGIDERAPYGARTAVIEPGALLVMCSDGLFEMKNPAGRLLGFDAVEKAITGIEPDLPPQRVVSALTQLAGSFSEGLPAEDDVTLLVIQRAGPHEEPA